MRKASSRDCRLAPDSGRQPSHFSRKSRRDVVFIRADANASSTPDSFHDDLKIAYKDLGALKPRVRNPRTHSARQVRQIAASIEQFGFMSPVLVDANDGIIAGHGRVAAAKLLGMREIPTIRADHLTPSQIRAYVIADNKLAENAGWDRNLLALELQELSVVLNFDVTVTGFETAEIDLLIGELGQTEPEEADNVPEIDRSKPAISRPGDLWRIGDHVLLCGDALELSSYRILLGSKKAQMVFIDPPYNVPIAGHVSGKGKFRHREFAMASGEMTRPEFTKFLKTIFERLKAFSTDGSATTNQARSHPSFNGCSKAGTRPTRRVN